MKLLETKFRFHPHIFTENPKRIHSQRWYYIPYTDKKGFP